MGLLLIFMAVLLHTATTDVHVCVLTNNLEDSINLVSSIRSAAPRPITHHKVKILCDSMIIKSERNQEEE